MSINNTQSVSTMGENKNLLPDVVKITRAEAKVLIPQLEALKRGDLGEVRINDGTQTITIRRGVGNQNLAAFLQTSVADTTLAQDMTISLGGHTFIRFLNAMRHWGDTESEFTLQFNDQVGFLRIQLAAGS